MKEFKKKFQIDALLIKKVGSWNISLRPKQVTIGSLVLSLDRKCPEMSDLTPEETKELSEAFKTINKIFSSSFNPNKLNYLALMMVDAQVHFHVIPRYENAVRFNEREYRDSDWPKPPDLSKPLDFTTAELSKLKNYLSEGGK